MKYINGLNTLRAFAVFFVFITHFGIWFDDTTVSGKIFAYIIIPGGGFGVRLFFVLSGFLITSILLSAKATQQSSGSVNIIKQFYIRRSLRIFPVYYLLLFVLLAQGFPDIRHYFQYYATYTSNILSYKLNAWNTYSHTWTLSVEEQFYLVWPWLIIMIKDKYLKYVFIAAIITGIVSTYIAESVHGHMPLLMHHSLDTFGMGGYYAWVRQNDWRAARHEKIIRTAGIPVLCMYFYWKTAMAFHMPVSSLFQMRAIEGAVSLWIIVLVVNNRSERWKKYLLEAKPLNYIGKISYGIYLFHYPYIAFYYGRVGSFFNNITTGHHRLNTMINDRHINYWVHFAIVIAVAAISYELIERPILKFKGRFSYSNRNKRVIPVL